MAINLQWRKQTAIRLEDWLTNRLDDEVYVGASAGNVVATTTIEITSVAAQ